MNRLFFQAVMGLALVMKPDDGGEGGGGGAPADKGGGAGSGGDKGGGNADLAKLAESLAASNKELMARLEKLEKAGGAHSKSDDLSDKARKERQAALSDKDRQGRLQDAMKFNLTSEAWLKDFTSIVPETVPAIFAAAAKENYPSDVEKAAAIKVGIIQEYFGQQANLDLLTASQKNSIEAFKKLTNDLKQDRAQAIWDQILEPTLENVRRTRRAELVSKGLGDPSDAESAHVKKMREHSRKAYLGVK